MNDIYISERSAHAAGIAAIMARKARSYTVVRALIRNPDRTLDRGFVVRLSK